MTYSISFFFLMLLVVSSGCGSSDDETSTRSSHQHSVAGTPDTNQLPPAVVLKEMEVNSKTIDGDCKFFKSRVLNENEIDRLSLRSIDTTGASNYATFKYHVVDTLFTNPRVTVLLIGREYTEENIVWLATYDTNSTLVDQLMVYYDNSEGSTQVGSVIKANEAEVTTFSDYAESPEKARKTERYRFDVNNKIVKIQ